MGPPLGSLHQLEEQLPGGRRVINIAIKRKDKNVTMVYLVNLLYPVCDFSGPKGPKAFGGDSKDGIYADDHGHNGHNGL